MEEETYKVTIWLIDGTKLKVHGPQTADTLNKLYKIVGAENGRLKVPTAPDKVQIIPERSVLRVEAVGNFS